MDIYTAFHLDNRNKKLYLYFENETGWRTPKQCCVGKVIIPYGCHMFSRRVFLYFCIIIIWCPPHSTSVWYCVCPFRPLHGVARNHVFCKLVYGLRSNRWKDNDNCVKRIAVMLCGLGWKYVCIIHWCKLIIFLNVTHCYLFQLILIRRISEHLTWKILVVFIDSTPTIGWVDIFLFDWKNHRLMMTLGS